MVKSGFKYYVCNCPMLPSRKVVEHINEFLPKEMHDSWMMCTIDDGGSDFDSPYYGKVIDYIALYMKGKLYRQSVQIISHSELEGYNHTVKTPSNVSSECVMVEWAFLNAIKKLRPEAKIMRKVGRKMVEVDITGYEGKRNKSL